jgi:hypothetical protein
MRATDKQVRCFFLGRVVTCGLFACVIAAFVLLHSTVVTDSRA